MRGRYILDAEHNAVPEDDLMVWARWFESAERTVALTKLPSDVRVSTVFLGLDHNFTGGPPLLFETMIFGGPHDGFQDRYSTWAEAERGHKTAVTLASSNESD